MVPSPPSPYLENGVTKSTMIRAAARCESANRSDYRYGWMARPGDWVCENPGVIHTLSVEDNTDIVFTITGSIEFFNDDDSLKFTLDIFSFAKMYYDHCKEKGIEPNDTLWH